MESIIPDIENLSEHLRGVLYRIVHCQDEFERNCFPKTDEEKKIKCAINDKLKTVIADTYAASEIITESLTLDSDVEEEQVIRKGGDFS